MQASTGSIYSTTAAGSSKNIAAIKQAAAAVCDYCMRLLFFL